MTWRKVKSEPPDPYPLVIETFQPPAMDLHRLAWFTGPTSFNSDVRIHRYRITAEQIEEPVEVAARLVKLWRECSSDRQREALQQMADKLNIKVDARDFGKDRKV